MDFLLQKARNGEDTCISAQKYYHSAYNPSNEAKSFVQNLQANIIPSCIIIIEPGFSYCIAPLRERFPNTKLIAIRLTTFFKDYDSNWDHVLYFKESSSLSSDLFNLLGEEELCATLFYEWRSTASFFPETTEVWHGIKNVMSKSKAVLLTRSYFSPRWLYNTVRFHQHVYKTATLNKVHSPIVITCSGPSLKTSISFLKKNRNKFLLIAVSSSLCALLNEKINPDLVLTTDGGYWAKKHLNAPGCDISKLVFAVPPEAAVPAEIFHSNTIIPLSYEDGFEKKYIQSKIDYTTIRRNGTVSGTALQLAQSLTDNKIFICGLDQASAKGYQHANPNALENINSAKDCRISPLAKRLCNSEFSSVESLEIYRQWFVQYSPTVEGRVFRISDNYNFKNDLGKIKDVDWNFFESQNFNTTEEKLSTDSTQSIKIDPFEIKKSIKSMPTSMNFRQDFFPLETIVLKKSLNNDEKIVIENKISNKISKIEEKLDFILSCTGKKS